MTPESEDYLAIARKDLREAKAILDIGIKTVAGRCAYFAAFPRSGGGDLRIDRQSRENAFWRAFRICASEPEPSRIERRTSHVLGQGLSLQQEGDYGIGPIDRLTHDAALGAVETAELFVGAVESLLRQPR